MKNSATKIAFSVFITAILIFTGWYLYQQFQDYDLPSLQKSIQETADRQVKIFTPSPLKSEADHPDSSLTKKGIISYTNKKRTEHNLKKFTKNNQLTKSAQAKAKDMLQNQYFAHQSPDNKGVSDLASQAGYDYLIIGENLAMGNFKNDKALIEAWMDSAGHRENILKEGYREIGIGLVKGEYQGDNVWLVVQHFGTSKLVCTRPAQTVKNQIENNNETLRKWKEQLNYLEDEIEKTSSKSRRYNELIREHNKLTEDYNSLLNETENLIESYNQSVADYNQCLKSYQ